VDSRRVLDRPHETYDARRSARSLVHRIADPSHENTPSASGEAEALAT
jgi:hypothetical protein